MTLSEALKRFRKEFKVTQKQAASIAGITERAYQDYETDKTKVPVAALVKLADAFDVSLDYLAGRVDAPKAGVNIIAISQADIDAIKRDLYDEVDRRLALRFPYAMPPPYQGFTAQSKRI